MVYAVFCIAVIHPKLQVKNCVCDCVSHLCPPGVTTVKGDDVKPPRFIMKQL